MTRGCVRVSDTFDPPVTFLIQVPGIYEVYVNNYRYHDSVEDIDFTVVSYINDATDTFEDTWDLGTRYTGDEPMGNMMHITTIEITQEMIDADYGSVFIAMKTPKNFKDETPF